MLVMLNSQDYYDSNQIYTWGDGSKGQLGYKMMKSYDPVLLEFFAYKQTIKASLGYYNTVIITKTDDVYLWGSNSYGKLGLGN